MKGITLLTFLITIASRAYCCSCTGTSEYSNGERTIEWYNDHEFVFTAQIDSVKTDSFKQTVYLTIKHSYKGDLPKHLSMSPPMFGTSCSFDLRGEEGNIYIVYAYKDSKGYINTHFCNGTNRMYLDKELDTLGIDKWRKKLLKQEKTFLESISNIPSGMVSAKYSNGRLSGKGFFKEGRPDSLWTYYSFEGEKISSGKFINGVKEGEWIEYTYSPFTKSNSYRSYSIGNYKNGLKDGKWKVVHSNGEYIEYYQNGEYIKK